jgi:hypothetical protein
MNIVKDFNYINFDPDYFDITKEKVFFVTDFDDNFVYGFRWGYVDSSKTRKYKLARDVFEKEYILKPQDF